MFKPKLSAQNRKPELNRGKWMMFNEKIIDTFKRSITRIMYVEDSIYMPAGPGKNVRNNIVRNPKIAMHIQRMHQSWLNKKFKI